MANVPTVSAPTVGPSVQRTPTPPLAAFGASVLGDALKGFAQTEEQASNVLAQHALKLAAEDAKMAADAAGDTFNIQANDVQTEFNNLQGLHAKEGYPSALTALASTRDKIAESITNPAAKSQFLAEAHNSSRYFIGQMAAHAGREYRTAVVASANATLDNKVAMAVKAYGTPTEDGIRATLVDQAMYINDELEGGDASTFEQRYRKINDAVISGVVGDRLTSNDPYGAKAVLDAHKDELHPDVVRQLQASVNAGVMPQEAKRAAEAAAGGIIAGASGGYVPPVSGPITSGFGHRERPTAGATTEHGGIDYGVPVGTSVSAAGAGEVIAAGPQGGYGNAVRIRHENGDVTLYGHLSGVDVKVGDQVLAGQVVGKSGATGTTTGPNLHFGLYRNGVAVDPRSAFGARTPAGSAAAIQASMPDVLANAERIARANPTYGNNETFVQTAVSNAYTLANRQMAALNGAESANQQSVYAAMNDAEVKGNPITSLADMTARYPQTQGALANLDPTQVRGLLNQLQQNSNPALNTMSDDQFTRYEVLKGQSASADPGTVSKFLNTPLLSENLPRSALRELSDIQNRLLKGEAAHAKLGPAMATATTQLRAAGIIGAQVDPTYKDQFAGALLSALQLYVDKNGEVPDDAAIRQITSNLLIGTGKTPAGDTVRAYEGKAPVGVVVGVPDADAEQIIAAFRARGQHGVISSDTIRAIYARAHPNGR